jgi:hypothetical protein
MLARVRSHGTGRGRSDGASGWIANTRDTAKDKEFELRRAIVQREKAAS